MPRSITATKYLNSRIDLESVSNIFRPIHPIEEAFSKIKHFIRRHQEYYGTTEGDGILFDMLEVLDIITPEDAEGYFQHAGYF
jgi:hypothetical protein